MRFLYEKITKRIQNFNGFCLFENVTLKREDRERSRWIYLLDIFWYSRGNCTQICQKKLKNDRKTFHINVEK